MDTLTNMVRALVAEMVREVKGNNFISGVNCFSTVTWSRLVLFVFGAKVVSDEPEQ